MASERMYTLDEVAKILKISRRHVNELIRSGRLHYSNLGYKLARVSQSDLDELIQSTRTTGPRQGRGAAKTAQAKKRAAARKKTAPKGAKRPKRAQ